MFYDLFVPNITCKALHLIEFPFNHHKLLLHECVSADVPTEAYTISSTMKCTKQEHLKLAEILKSVLKKIAYNFNHIHTSITPKYDFLEDYY